MSINYKPCFYKDFTEGFVKKLFYIDKNGIITLYYFDDVLYGEAEEYRFLKKGEPTGLWKFYSYDGYKDYKALKKQ